MLAYKIKRMVRFPDVHFAVIPTSMESYLPRDIRDISPRYTPRFLRSARYEVDYDAPDAMEKALAETGIRDLGLGMKPGEIALGGRGKCTVLVEECCVGRAVCAHEITRQVVIGKSCIFCPPLAAVRYPRVKRPGMADILVTFFTSSRDGGLYQVAIGDYEGGLGIRVQKTLPDHVFPEDASFLVIDRKKQP
jgi:hypothetical protein